MKTRLSNGDLSPLVFSHMPGDSSSGPFPVRPSKRKNILRLLTTFKYICTEKIESCKFHSVSLGCLSIPKVRC